MLMTFLLLMWFLTRSSPSQGSAGYGDDQLLRLSRFDKAKNFTECQQYVWMEDGSVGCRVPYVRGSRFNTLLTKLLWANVSIEEHHELRSMVKMNPPTNLSLVKLENNSGLWLYWNSSMLPSCMENAVRYRKDWESWKDLSVGTRTSFNIPVPSEYSSYTFQVKVRVSSSCGESRFWSEWSSPVFWRPARTKEPPDTRGMFDLFLYFIIGVLLFIASVGVLLYYKRLIPVAPSPGKNLKDLLHTYNGNVEEWLHACIPKELVEGFKPNFCESACTVREYRLIPQATLQRSTCSLPFLTDQSDGTDCLFTSCSTSTSSISSPMGNTPPTCNGHHADDVQPPRVVHPAV
nr:cytokine receptor common subunit gamma-like isoform X2 [Paramormyrops kingsleyae]